MGAFFQHWQQTRLAESLRIPSIDDNANHSHLSRAQQTSRRHLSTPASDRDPTTFIGIVRSVFERYHRELLNFLARQVKDRDTAADLAQESFVRVLSAQSAGIAVQDMRALLYRTARNLVIDQHRRAVHRQHDDIDALGDMEQPLAPQHQQPDEILAYEQQASVLVRAIGALPPRCREAFVLNRFEGLSHQEVAERMGISKNMVAQHVARGILSCQACLMRNTATSMDGPLARLQK